MTMDKLDEAMTPNADPNEKPDSDGNPIATTISNAEEISDPLDGLVERTAEDPGAPFRPEVLARLFVPGGRIEPEELAGFATPALMLVGEHDALFPGDTLRDVAGLIPGTRVVDFPGCGHSTYFEDPERFNRVVGEFVAAHA